MVTKLQSCLVGYCTATCSCTGLQYLLCSNGFCHVDIVPYHCVKSLCPFKAFPLQHFRCIQ